MTQRISLLIVLVLLGAVGCDSPPRTPAAVVTRYFDTIGRDPMRTMLLLSPAYHETHGLNVEALEDWSWGYSWVNVPEAAPNPGLAPLDTERDLDTSKLAWLMVQLEQNFRRVAVQARHSIIHELTVRNRARVEVQIRPPAGLKFTQSFRLSRADERSPWLIDAIEQEGVVMREAYVAFTLNPNEEMRQNILRRIKHLTRGPVLPEGP